MKHLSQKLLAETVVSRRKTLKLSQAALSEQSGINRSILSRLESCDYAPSVDQLLSLSTILGFQLSDVIVEDEAAPVQVGRKKIAIRKLLAFRYVAGEAGNALAEDARNPQSGGCTDWHHRSSCGRDKGIPESTRSDC